MGGGDGVGGGVGVEDEGGGKGGRRTMMILLPSTQSCDYDTNFGIQVRNKSRFNSGFEYVDSIK